MHVEFCAQSLNFQITSVDDKRMFLIFFYGEVGLSRQIECAGISFEFFRIDQNTSGVDVYCGTVGQDYMCSV